MDLSCVQYQETKAFLTVQEASRILSISDYSVYKLIHSGKLPAVQLGRRFKIKAEDLIRYVDMTQL